MNTKQNYYEILLKQSNNVKIDRGMVTWHNKGWGWSIANKHLLQLSYLYASNAYKQIQLMSIVVGEQTFTDKIKDPQDHIK